MPVYKWDDLEETFITPSHTKVRGKSIIGKGLLFQRIVHHGELGWHSIARPHSHPEEQMIIPLEGRMKLRIGNELLVGGPGDIFLMPAETEHEEFCEGDFLFFNIKIRIPGHSWYDHSWRPGAEEGWRKAKAILDEMDSNYREVTPWHKAEDVL